MGAYTHSLTCDINSTPFHFSPHLYSWTYSHTNPWCALMAQIPTRAHITQTITSTHGRRRQRRQANADARIIH